MISLFLDTSSENLYVAIVRDDKILFEKIVKTKNDHSTYLVSIIREGLENNNLSVKDIDRIFTTIGPGSFTGTRISITVAKTLAWALKINVIPISSLKQYIFSYKNYDYYIPVIEDKRGLYYAIYDNKYESVDEEKYINKEKFNEIVSDLKGKVLIISNNKYDFDVKPKKVNILALIKFFEKNDGINPHKLKPNYIKKIEAESKL